MDKELEVLSQIQVEKGLWKGWDNEIFLQKCQSEEFVRQSEDHLLYNVRQIEGCEKKCAIEALVGEKNSFRQL